MKNYRVIYVFKNGREKKSPWQSLSDMTINEFIKGALQNGNPHCFKKVNGKLESVYPKTWYVEFK